MRPFCFANNARFGSQPQRARARPHRTLMRPVRRCDGALNYAARAVVIKLNACVACACCVRANVFVCKCEETMVCLCACSDALFSRPSLQ